MRADDLILNLLFFVGEDLLPVPHLLRLRSMVGLGYGTRGKFMQPSRSLKYGVELPPDPQQVQQRQRHRRHAQDAQPLIHQIHIHKILMKCIIRGETFSTYFLIHRILRFHPQIC